MTGCPTWNSTGSQLSIILDPFKVERIGIIETPINPESGMALTSSFGDLFPSGAQLTS